MGAFSNNKLRNYLRNKQIRLFKISAISWALHMNLFFKCPRIHNRIQNYKSKHGIPIKNIPFNLKGEKKMLRHISLMKNSLASDEDSTSLEFSSLFYTDDKKKSQRWT